MFKIQSMATHNPEKKKKEKKKQLTLEDTHVTQSGINWIVCFNISLVTQDLSVPGPQ